MDSQTRLGLELLAAALLLGLLGDQLLHVAPWGLNASVWIGCLIVASYGLAYRWRPPLVRAERWFILPLCMLALLYLGRDAAILKLVNMGALLLVLALGIQRAQVSRLRRHASVPIEPPGVLAVGAKALVRLPVFLARDIDWKSLPAEGRGPKAAAVGRGVLLALPVLVLFGVLFAKADVVFEALVSRVFVVDLEHLPGHLLLTIVFAWIVGGFFYGMLMKMARGAEEADDTTGQPSRFALGIVEVSVVLGLINLLFAVFVLVQLTYLFGGYRTVLGTANLTLAQYARHGFFELVAVASLALPLLLCLRRLLAVKAGRPLRLFHLLAGVQVGLLFLILASAAQRMWLYQQSYGLTELRLYVSAFLVWLAFVLGWLMLNLLRDRVEHFMPGAVAAGFVVILGLHIVNPDALIVKTNVARTVIGNSFDTAYMTSLSADAVPALLDTLSLLPPQQQQQVAQHLIDQWRRPAWADWRTWSRARATAWRAVEANATTLRQLARHAVVRPSTPSTPAEKPLDGTTPSVFKPSRTVLGGFWKTCRQERQEAVRLMDPRAYLG